MGISNTLYTYRVLYHHVTMVIDQPCFDSPWQSFPIASCLALFSSHPSLSDQSLIIHHQLVVLILTLLIKLFPFLICSWFWPELFASRWFLVALKMDCIIVIINRVIVFSIIEHVMRPSNTKCRLTSLIHNCGRRRRRVGRGSGSCACRSKGYRTWGTWWWCLLIETG